MPFPRNNPRKPWSLLRRILCICFPSEVSRSSTEEDRYDVCNRLAEKGIPNGIWFEDLLVFYGSDTQVWDLNLLVRDPGEAANVLVEAGYVETSADSQYDFMPEIVDRGVRLQRQHGTTGVVLLPAQDWDWECELEDDGTVRRRRSSLPPLHQFLDSMMGVWLHISSRDYVERLQFALHIGCLINYCYYLKDGDGDNVKDPAYADKLKPEHRELHYDIVAEYPRKESFVTTSRHQYHIRRSREIQDGTWTPQPYRKTGFRASLTTLQEK
ncbi:MAG: hypothetical protein M1837_005226 [Sclerophora amabilis]|nr:MAG: hypothetical protein M1837_005226 [Sclerophora amabilis]